MWLSKLTWVRQSIFCPTVCVCIFLAVRQAEEEEDMSRNNILLNKIWPVFLTMPAVQVDSVDILSGCLNYMFNFSGSFCGTDELVLIKLYTSVSTITSYLFLGWIIHALYEWLLNFKFILFIYLFFIIVYRRSRGLRSCHNSSTLTTLMTTR